MTSSDVVLATSSPPPTQDPNTQRKSGRAIRKPDLFAREHHEGSVISNDSSVKRKRQQESDAFPNQNGHGEDVRDSHTESENDDERSTIEEDASRRRAKSTGRNRKAASKSSTKRPRTSASPSRALAIRPANVPSKSAVQKAKSQKARARPSQVNREGLYGRRPV